MTLPLALAAAIGIRASMGAPILFRRERPGLGEKSFTVVKLRTMTAEDLRGRVAIDHDVRLMALARFLRRPSIDALPQFMNVLRGEMSIVGPRPLLVGYLQFHSLEQRKRHDGKPASPVETGMRSERSDMGPN